MRDFDKIYRLAIYNSLTGNIGGKNVYDEVKKVSATDTQFVLFGAQSSSPDAETDSAFGRKCSIELMIVDKRGVSVTKDDIDDLSELVLTQLFQAVGVLNVAVPSGFQFGNARFDTGFTRPTQLSPTESIMAKVITITTTIIQQN